MKIFRLFLLLLLLPAVAGAELALDLSADCLAVNAVVDFTLTGAASDSYQYTVLRDGTELFAHETPMTVGSYVPRQPGRYTLIAQAGEETAQASFTVTEELRLVLADMPDNIRAGQPVFPSPQASGGSGNYSYVYTITAPDGTRQAWQAGEDWHWVPDEPGAWALTVTASDSTGAAAEAEAALTVSQGPGISVQATGGALLAHGGQKSWQVYAPGEWTASTTDAFIAIEPATGASGDTLNVTIRETTTQARTGSIMITSGGKQFTLNITQSGGHGVDEEFTLGATAPVLVDGEEHTAWLNAEGSRVFAITGHGWQAETADAFISVEQRGNMLTLAVEPPIATARHGLVTIQRESGTAYVHVYQPAAGSGAAIAAQLLPAEDAQRFILYSQCSGYWKNQPYGKSNLEQSGCAIFALSHVLQEMGFEDPRITPQYLADSYSFALREGGTINATLVGNVGDDLGYKTRYELYTSLPTIQKKLREGAMFTFEVARGHIAAVVELSPDGSMCRIIDSAPSATFERITNASLHRQLSDGTFSPITALTELEGIRYYIETGAFGGAEYWLETSYVARRGVRLIQPTD